jgi:hypothetical protein
VLFTVSLTPPAPGMLTLGTLTGEDPDEPPPDVPPPEPPPVPGALVVEDRDPARPVSSEPFPAPAPLESRPVTVARPECDSTEEPVPPASVRADRSEPPEPVGSVFVEAAASVAVGVASGPWASAERPPATPEKLAPNPISTATPTGMAHRTAPAIPEDAVRRCHQASNPLPMETSGRAPTRVAR